MADSISHGWKQKPPTHVLVYYTCYLKSYQQTSHTLSYRLGICIPPKSYIKTQRTELSGASVQRYRPFQRLAFSGGLLALWFLAPCCITVGKNHIHLSFFCVPPAILLWISKKDFFFLLRPVVCLSTKSRTISCSCLPRIKPWAFLMLNTYLLEDWMMDRGNLGDEITISLFWKLP